MSDDLEGSGRGRRAPLPDITFVETKDYDAFRAALAENERRVLDTDLALCSKHIARLNAILIAEIGQEEFERQHGKARVQRVNC